MSLRKLLFRRQLIPLYREFRRRNAIRAKGRAADIGAGDQPVTIARIIGNDLYPRHAEGQAIKNLSFILENEPDFPGCEKLFVLNRIFDEDSRREAERLVNSSGHRLLVLPFLADEYRKVACDTSAFGGAAYFAGSEFDGQSEIEKSQARLWACAPKVRYAMNINGARNAALGYGRSHGGWTVVLDGSCILTADDGERLLREIRSLPFVPYIVIPMQRLETNALFHLGSAKEKADQEPQLAIHNSAVESFDEVYPYGLRNKTSLLEKIGVLGPWSYWNHIPWLPVDQSLSPDRYLYKYSSATVLRLSSGIQEGALERKDAHNLRYHSRNAAVFRTLSILDERFDAADREHARKLMGIEG